MNKDRLFLASCVSLIATAFWFAIVGAAMGGMKSDFILSNEQVGEIAGAAVWGFTISIFALGPLVDFLGMRNLMRFALLCQVAGPLLMIFAGGESAYWMLYFGALTVALGNGTVEAVCNPLVAGLYPDQKTKKLNQFHVWFPGGIVIGAVLCFLMDQVSKWSGEESALAGINDWRVKLGLIIIPAIAYGILFIGQTFPKTERVQSGVTFGGMVSGAFGRPLFLIMLLCMCITASLELGPNRWIPPVLEAGNIPGILVLAYISGLMAVLRFYAGPVVHRLSPTGILVCSAVLSGVGLFWFSYADSIVMAFASATLFAVGVCYFWPTMLGFVSERVPRSGALGLALVGGMGMLAVGTVTAPQMGRIADDYLYENLDKAETHAALQGVLDVYPDLALSEPDVIRGEIEEAVRLASEVLAADELPKGGDYDTANVLRFCISNAPSDDAAKKVKGAVAGVLNPADNYGGRMSFRYIAPFSLVIILVFGLIYLRDRAAGGYKPEVISEGPDDGDSPAA